MPTKTQINSKNIRNGALITIPIVNYFISSNEDITQMMLNLYGDNEEMMFHTFGRCNFSMRTSHINKIWIIKHNCQPDSHLQNAGRGIDFLVYCSKRGTDLEMVREDDIRFYQNIPKDKLEQETPIVRSFVEYLNNAIITYRANHEKQKGTR